MRSLRLTMWLAGAAVAVAVPAFAGSKAPSAVEARSPGERDFLVRLHDKNQQEVDLGLLAVSRAQTPEVKALGQRLVHDYQSLNEELFRYATKRGVRILEPDSGVGGSGTDSQYARLAQLPGPEFERAFLKTVMEDSRALRDSAPKDAPSAQLNQLQGERLRMNNDHLERAQSLLQHLPEQSGK